MKSKTQISHSKQQKNNTQQSNSTSKKTILIIVLIAIALSITYLEMMKPSYESNSPSTTPANFKDGKYPLAPELTGISGYINTPEGLTLSSLRGKVVIVDFWTYTCINCIRTLPYLKSWDEKYRDKGLVIIGVHTPEFNFEKEYVNVADAVQREGIQYPVVLDNEYGTWGAFKNRYWPRKYLIDADGYIRYDHIGEGGYEETEKQIQELLSEIGEDVDEELTSSESETNLLPRTPELYLGANYALPRGQDIGNLGGLQAGETSDYILPFSRNRNVIYLSGSWQSGSDNLISAKDGASLYLDLAAASANVVADGPKDAKLFVFINDMPVSQEQAGKDILYDGDKSYVLIDSPRLYALIDGDYGLYSLRLEAQKPGISLHAFTFG